MQGSLKKASNSRSLGYVEFRLVDSSRRIPEFPRELSDDGYYDGHVKIFSCPRNPSYVGKTCKFFGYHIPSCAPYFIYSTDAAQIDYKDTITTSKDSKPCKWRLADHLVMDDLKYMVIHEIGMTSLGLSVLDDLPFDVKIPIAELNAAFPQDAGVLFEKTDMKRLAYLVDLSVFNVKGDMKQRKKLLDLPSKALQEIKSALLTCPWELLWWETRPYKLKPLTEAAYCRLPNRPQPPYHIEIALRVFFNCQRERTEGNHTIFYKASLKRMIPCAPPELDGQVFAYLLERDMCWVHEGVSLAMKRDYWDAQTVRESLAEIQERSIDTKFETRGFQVPCIPPALTPRQKEIAHTIQQEWLCIVEGSPGTGKTALGTWVYSHYSRCMCTGFVGMLIRMLQTRNGGRQEAGYTIHYLLTIAKMIPKEQLHAWLSQIQVLIVEEFSNVSMHLFAKLLNLFRGHISKLILIGDTKQLAPIDPGNPMRDLVDMFGSHRLTENLRVQPHLRDLQDAPIHILHNQPNMIKFHPRGPISLLPKTDSLVDIFREIIALPNGRLPMNVHIVVLQNEGKDGRKHINMLAQDALEKLGVLHRQNVVRVGKLQLFVGCKICFLQNYNRPMPECATVSNGELAIITSIRQTRGGVSMTITDDYETEKTVFIHHQTGLGIHPRHVDLGYARTSYTTQGREFDYVIFWNPSKPGPQWTRAHAYVAVSRGKQRVWVAGTREDFLSICQNADKSRRSCFAMLMCARPLGKVAARESVDPIPPHLLSLMDKSVKATPVLKQNEKDESD